MTIPDPTYITADEVKAQTLLDGLGDLNPEDIAKLIRIAEDDIDAHVGPQERHPDNTIDRVFPRVYDLDEDGNTEIPYLVSVATLRQVEWLYSNWWDTRTNSLLPMKHDIESFRIGGDGSYGETRSRKGEVSSDNTLAPQARVKLKDFVSRTAAIGVTDPDKVPRAT